MFEDRDKVRLIVAPNDIDFVTPPDFPVPDEGLPTDLVM